MLMLSISCFSNSGAAAQPISAMPSDTIFFDNGGWYCGQIADSLFNGFGTMRYSDGTVYSGEWSNGEWSGEGVLEFCDGDKYEGKFKDNTMNGFGIYTYNDSSIYQGNFKNGRFDGFGYMKYADGGIYVGFYKEDLRHGKGSLYSASDKTLYEGYFYEDEYVGSDPALYEQAVDNPVSLITEEGTYFSAGIEYGSRNMLIIDGAYFIDDCSYGINLMIGTDIPCIGRNANSRVKWNEYRSDEISEGTYTSFAMTAEFGYRIAEHTYAGYGLGFGIENDYRNCRVREGSESFGGYPAGTYYFKTKPGSVLFEYRIFCRFIIPSTNRTRLMINIALGHLEGFSAGFGLRF